MSEDLAKHLGVLVCEAPRVDILAAVLVALKFGVANTRDSKLIEFVVPTNAAESYPIVYFRNFP